MVATTVPLDGVPRYSAETPCFRQAADACSKVRPREMLVVNWTARVAFARFNLVCCTHEYTHVQSRFACAVIRPTEDFARLCRAMPFAEGT